MCPVLFRTPVLFGYVAVLKLPRLCFCEQLLMPHVRTSLQINYGARVSLLAPNGVFDKVEPGTRY